MVKCVISEPPNETAKLAVKHFLYYIEMLANIRCLQKCISSENTENKALRYFLCACLSVGQTDR